MNDAVAVVIPVYKESLDWYEEISLRRVVQILRNYLIIFVAPKSLTFGYRNICENHDVYRFPDEFFTDIRAYNSLMLSERFYIRFLHYDYILLYQLDAFVFYDGLIKFCDMGYEYIGAPWMECPTVYKGGKALLHVGNGGFSLRKVDAMLSVLRKEKSLLKTWTGNEDVFFALCGKYRKCLKVAPRKIAYAFSWERPVERCCRRSGGRLPFGCHQWMKFGKEIYCKLFKEECGIDLSEYQAQMEDADRYDVEAYYSPLILKRIFSRHSLHHYLDSNEWSVFGIGKYGKLLCEALLHEGFVLGRLFDNDANKYGTTILGRVVESPHNIRCGQEKIIIGVSQHEKVVMTQLAGMGLKYGKDFVSLPYEYLKRVMGLKDI